MNIMKRILIWVVCLLVLGISPAVKAIKPSKVEVREVASEKKVEVLVDGKLFTAYIYPENIKKPVLWPVVTPEGNMVTRSFPLVVKAGERADHPHHVGIWLNYGNVNGLDFWNNSEAIPVEKAGGYGAILHRSVDKIRNGRRDASLTVGADWVDSNGKKLLDEKSAFRFLANPKLRIIDRTTTLTAVEGNVSFADNKEGMFAIRVTSELELPAKGALELTDAHGNVTRVEKPDQSKVSGNYLSSEGITGADVWGTRGKWMQLSGRMNGEEVSVVIIDHPSNPGYPTYWHARGYGLFAANPLGQKALSGGKEELNFVLSKGKSVTFRYRLVVYSGKMTPSDIQKLTNSYICCRKSKLFNREW